MTEHTQSIDDFARSLNAVGRWINNARFRVTTEGTSVEKERGVAVDTIVELAPYVTRAEFQIIADNLKFWGEQ